MTVALALVVKLHLKKTKRVVGAASAAVELDKRQGASGNGGNDGVRALLALACDSDLIASAADDVDAALVFLLQGTAKSIGSFP